MTEYTTEKSIEIITDEKGEHLKAGRKMTMNKIQNRGMYNKDEALRAVL